LTSAEGEQQPVVNLSSSEPEELSFAMRKNYVGHLRLQTAELLRRALICLGPRMLSVYMEADLFSVLLKLYALYPFSDMVLSMITSVLAHGLDFDKAKA